jgi:hypothetical protein
MLKPFLELLIASIIEGIHIKELVVKPIYKKRTERRCKQLLSNYSCPALSKIVEKVIANQLIYFLDRHNILIKSQFGCA